ncbi:MAG TPA: hypothetical protein VF622_03415 [Segetibacter sp.]|jgi:hypothetical protein
MKLRKINILTAIAFGAVITFAGCSKDDGAIPKNIGIEDVPVISMNYETANANVLTKTITFSTSAAFTDNFKATQYFPNALAPTKIDISVRKGNVVSTAATLSIATQIPNTNVKTFKADITSLPATFTITAADITTLFGPISANDVYDFGPDITVNGKKYSAFPAQSYGSGSGPNGMSIIGFGEYVRYWFK